MAISSSSMNPSGLVLVLNGENYLSSTVIAWPDLK